MIVNPDDPPYNAVGDGMTDDTAAFNAAMASIRSTGGVFEMSPKAYKLTSWDCTNLNSVIIRGQGGGIGSPTQGAKIITGGGAAPTIDFSGSAVTCQDFEVYNPFSSPVNVGIMCGQMAGFPNNVVNAGTLCSFTRIFTRGLFAHSAFYSFGVGDSIMDQCRIWNNQPAAIATVTLANGNFLGTPSAYQSLMMGEIGCPPWLWRKSEIHDYVPGSNVRPASGCGLLLIGMSSVSIKDQSSIDSSTASQGGIICQNSPMGVHCGMLRLEEMTGYSENNLPPWYGIYVTPGSTLDTLAYDYWAQTFVASRTVGTIGRTIGLQAPV